MRRTVLVAGLAVSVLAFASQLLSLGLSPPEPVPEDVLENSDIARERMRELHLGLNIYANVHGMLPDDPAVLYPDYVSDPLTFWHPGDTDPPPSTIDNSVPNAPNSARISFEMALDVPEWHVADEIVIWDNTAANNGGLFVNMLTSDGIIETDPPLATPTPTAIALAQA
ncbi:MAG: hypothetical protein ACYSVY_07995, partial [Planctomycetota bacterium]